MCYDDLLTQCSEMSSDSYRVDKVLLQIQTCSKYFPMTCPYIFSPDYIADSDLYIYEHEEHVRCYVRHKEQAAVSLSKDKLHVVSHQWI